MIAAGLVLSTASGCTTIVGPGSGGATSRAAEPPASWDSAILFQFRDAVSDPNTNFTARVELQGDATSPRTVTGHDVYLTETGFLRTPWYRLRIADLDSTRMVVRVVLDHATGGRSEAEYPLTIKRAEFYYVSFGVGTREPPRPHMPDLVQELRSYPVPAGARRLPSDSLWIGYYKAGRYCFTCPR
ncbi:MAG TPA: hypothetical protein VK358_13510 [Longimicrobium sp.]|nr:hypothetical protein [Longimicrobium sp.]